MPRVCVVIPAFNEEKSIEKAVKGVKPFAKEIIVVDDGSTDRTAELAEKAGARVVKNAQNSGYEASIENGFRQAIGKGFGIVITMDADGQHFPENIPKFVELVSSGKADIVVGARNRKQRFAEKLFGAYFSRFGISDPLSGFKAYNAEVFREAGFFDKVKAIGSELVLVSVLNGKKVIELPIKTRERDDKPRIAAGIKGNLVFSAALLRLILRYAWGRKIKNKNQAKDM